MVLAIAVAAVVWGSIEPRFFLDEREIEARVPHLPPAWDGEEIAVIADLQVGMKLANVDMVRRVIERIVERGPRALLVAGDFVYRPEADLEEQIALLRELFAPIADASIPVYAVLGNHDWGMSDRSEKDPRPELARRLREELDGMGIRVLSGERAWIEADGERLALVGIGSHWAARDGIERAFAHLSPTEPRIVLMHHPDSYERIPANLAPFAIAAHTHGGQVRFPFLPHSTWMTFVVDDEVHADGWIEESYGEAGNRLYVNRGIGFSRVPLRINARPELTFVRLRATPSPEGFEAS